MNTGREDKSWLMGGCGMTQMTGTTGHIPGRLIDVKGQAGGWAMEDAAENRRKRGREDASGRRWEWKWKKIGRPRHGRDGTASTERSWHMSDGCESVSWENLGMIMMGREV